MHDPNCPRLGERSAPGDVDGAVLAHRALDAGDFEDQIGELAVLERRFDLRPWQRRREGAELRERSLVDQPRPRRVMLEYRVEREAGERSLRRARSVLARRVALLDGETAHARRAGARLGGERRGGDPALGRQP
jgi:hypothetical protein